MTAYLFFLFPDEDEVLQMIASDPSRVTTILHGLNNVKTQLRERNIDFQLCYDSENLQIFLDSVSTLDGDNRYINIVNRIKAILMRHSVDVCTYDKSDISHIYSQWITENAACTTDVSKLFKNLCCYEKPGLYSFRRSDSKNTEVDIIEDAVHESSLPRLLRIPLFVCTEDCILWLDSFLKGHFTLVNNSDFLRTSFRWNNQTMYQNDYSGDYWYYDYYHREGGKPHYEVFNKKGEHIGEADIDGKLKENSADGSKSISHILHGN